jgi:hypothetical protein
MIKMDKKLTIEEMDQVSGGMTTAEWDDYTKKYDKAMIRAQMAGDNGLLEKLIKERPKLPADYRPMDCLMKKYDLSAGGKPPYADWKLKDMPNVELIYTMDKVARFFRR